VGQTGHKFRKRTGLATRANTGVETAKRQKRRPEHVPCRAVPGQRHRTASGDRNATRSRCARAGLDDKDAHQSAATAQRTVELPGIIPVALFSTMTSGPSPRRRLLAPRGGRSRLHSHCWPASLRLRDKRQSLSAGHRMQWAITAARIRWRSRPQRDRLLMSAACASSQHHRLHCGWAAPFSLTSIEVR
jgi:hypothetical protein